jgi:hypothetical protein
VRSGGSWGKCIAAAAPPQEPGTGIRGKMEIIIEDGKHSYVFDYTLP